ncbi:hypothetical protein [Antarctobacter jejuensis]|uniref:hypothetical protein n=1 Tax=Antarctobacter jejuensis TaxID=1439938 RepID=UPI003FD084B3
MSDPVTNVEIEDVLSSIRRLVSEEARPRRAPEVAAPERLVLSPALRVAERQDDEGDVAEDPADDAAIGDGSDDPEIAVSEPDLTDAPVVLTAPVAPDVTEPEMPEPELAELDLPEAELSERDLPDLPELELAEPDLPEPDLPEPELLEPVFLRSEAGQPVPVRGIEEAMRKAALFLKPQDRADTIAVEAEPEPEPEPEPVAQADAQTNETFGAGATLADRDDAILLSGDMTPVDDAPAAASPEEMDAHKSEAEQLAALRASLTDILVTDPEDPAPEDSYSEDVQGWSEDGEPALPDSKAEVEAREDTLDLKIALLEGLLQRQALGMTPATPDPQDTPIRDTFEAFEAEREAPDSAAPILDTQPEPATPVEALPDLAEMTPEAAEPFPEDQDVSASAEPLDVSDSLEFTDTIEAEEKIYLEDNIEPLEAAHPEVLETATPDEVREFEAEVAKAAFDPSDLTPEENAVDPEVGEDPSPVEPASVEVGPEQADTELPDSELSGAAFLRHGSSPSIDWEDHLPAAQEPAAEPEPPAEREAASLPAEMDEEALQDLVANIVRQELQGVLGERITRNVRKLVRREIHRVLMSKEFD